MIEHRLSCIIRPDANGDWFIQNDTDHYASGFYSLEQMSDHLKLSFQSSYDKAGVVHICPDDYFGGSLEAHGNLGLSSTLISIRTRFNGNPPIPIDPKRVWEYLPFHEPIGGNFWVAITMWLNE